MLRSIDQLTKEKHPNLQIKTIFKIIELEKIEDCVDVSWLSPFSNERELIIRGQFVAILQPTKWNLEDRWSHSLKKTVILRPFQLKKTSRSIFETDNSEDFNQVMINEDLEKYFRILKGNVKKLQHFYPILTKNGL